MSLMENRHHRTGLARKDRLAVRLLSARAEERAAARAEAAESLHPGMLPAFHQVAHDPALATLPEDEIVMTLAVYADLAGAKAAPVFAWLLHEGRGAASVRVAAAFALGRLGTVDAKAELRRARFCLKSVVRRAVRAALANDLPAIAPARGAREEDRDHGALDAPAPLANAERVSIAPIELSDADETFEVERLGEVSAPVRLPSSALLGPAGRLPSSALLGPAGLPRWPSVDDRAATVVARAPSGVALLPVRRARLASRTRRAPARA